MDPGKILVVVAEEQIHFPAAMPPPPQQSDAHLISVLLFDVCIQFVEVPLLLRYYLDSDIYHLFCLSFHPLNSKDDET